MGADTMTEKDSLLKATAGFIGTKSNEAESIRTSLLSGSSNKLHSIHMISDGEPTLVAIDMDKDTCKFRFIGPDERVDVQQTNKFITLEAGEIDAILGRTVSFGPDRKPILSDEDMKVMQAAMVLRYHVIENPNLDEHGKRRLLHKLRRQTVFDAKKKAISALESEADTTARRLAAIEELNAWLRLTPTLSKPDGSQYAQALTAEHNNDLIFPLLPDTAGTPEVLRGALDTSHIFVVEHDWASVFRSAKIDGGDGNTSTGEITLPFDDCVFEFVIAGKRVCALFSFDPKQPPSVIVIPLIKFKAGWTLISPYDLTDNWKLIPSRRRDDIDMILDAAQPPMDVIAANVRAIAISLEAEVTQTEMIRVPAKLNAARERRGKPPLIDYHVVSLARRSRPEPLPRGDLDPNREITRKRLHFRRGHWRHFPNHRTWIKWMLVGNPDLGFIDKHYRL